MAILEKRTNLLSQIQELCLYFEGWHREWRRNNIWPVFGYKPHRRWLRVPFKKISLPNSVQTKSWIAEFKFVHYSCQTRYLPFPSANQVHESIVKVGENLKWRTWSGCISFAFFKFSRSQSEFKPQPAGWWPFSWFLPLATYQLLTQWDPWSVFYDAYHQWMTAQLEARVSLLETTYGYSRIQLILVVLIRKLPGINISLKLRSTWQKKLYSLSKNLQSHWHDFSILIGCVICAILFFLYHFLLARIPATAGLHHIRSQDDTGNARWMEGPLDSTLLDFA